MVMMALHVKNYGQEANMKYSTPTAQTSRDMQVTQTWMKARPVSHKTRGALLQSSEETNYLQSIKAKAIHRRDNIKEVPFPIPVVVDSLSGWQQNALLLISLLQCMFAQHVHVNLKH